ncbi:MAG: hypothetical protein PVSMB4_10380 [Ktedonobacterales bacterium]
MSQSIVPMGTYDLPRAPRELAAALSVPLERILKLDANESAYGPPPAALAALADFVAGGASLGRYPDPAATDLRAALAAYTGVGAERIVAGNGSDELIELLVALTIAPGDEVVVCEPTFPLYALAARRAGAAVVSVPLDAGDFAVRVEDVLAAITPRTRLVFLCGPNNPTGTPLPHGAVEALLGQGPLLIVDEAYHEFARASEPGDGPAFAPAGSSYAAALVAAGRELVVLRTFSKAFGLASLRVGYALCPTDLASRLRARKAPYNVNVAGLVAARAALDQLDWVTERAGALVHERDQLARRLTDLPGLRVYPSTANFLLVERVAPDTAPGSAPDATPAPDQSADATALARGLQAQGVLVRRFEHPRLARCIRVSVGTPEESEVLLAALATVLGGKSDLPSRPQPPTGNGKLGGHTWLPTPMLAQAAERESHRRAARSRTTRETDIRVVLDLDGTGQTRIATGVPFLDHMLTALARHGHFDLEIAATGDTAVDDHHTVEDVGLVLGQVLLLALGERRGIARFGSAYVPMDDALARAVVDLSGRPYLAYERGPVALAARVGTFDTDLAEEFWRALTNEARLTLHLDLVRARNAHHALEALFKAGGLALRGATRVTDPAGSVPSTKGVLG